MSIEDFSDPKSIAYRFCEKPPVACFFCGRPFASRVVHWHGHNGDISVHRECANTLAMRLITDAEHLRRIELGKPPLAGISKADIIL